MHWFRALLIVLLGVSALANFIACGGHLKDEKGSASFWAFFSGAVDVFLVVGVSVWL